MPAQGNVLVLEVRRCLFVSVEAFGGSRHLLIREASDRLAVFQHEGDIVCPDLEHCPGPP